MVKSMTRRMTRLAFAILLVLGMLGVALATPSRAEAATLKSSGASLTLKKGVQQQSNLWFAGAGQTKWYAKVANYTVKNAKPGYKIMTCKVILTRKWTPTKSQIVSMINSSKSLYRKEHGYTPTGTVNLYWGNSEVFLVDGSNGANLCADKWFQKSGLYSYNISSPDFRGAKTYRNGSYSVTLPTNIVYTVKVTYETGYKGFYLGVGTGSRQFAAKTQAKYDKGTVSYMNSFWHKYNKGTTRFLKVN